ncbi:MAG: biotin transporter BioY, partial [Candidatus Nanopelagicales bacterium]|nr:biotin transporter BioY [Candidatus Nanopelagicales bacterium]
MALASPAPRVLADYAARTALAQIALVFSGAVFVGIAAQVAIPLPFTPVPLTLQTFAVLLAGAALGSLRGVASMALYALMGVVGVPWFSEGSSGFSTASFGYILGFILAAFIVGRLAERGASTTSIQSAALMVIGNLAIYAVGVTWLKFAIDSSWATALSLGVVPFLIGDAIKIALAAGLLPLSWKGLEKLNLR